VSSFFFNLSDRKQRERERENKERERERERERENGDERRDKKATR